jgi:hypothetical protein
MELCIALIKVTTNFVPALRFVVFTVVIMKNAFSGMLRRVALVRTVVSEKT